VVIGRFVLLWRFGELDIVLGVILYGVRQIVIIQY
jgi:hypothetical protein